MIHSLVNRLRLSHMQLEPLAGQEQSYTWALLVLSDTLCQK
jgi:hypothetical protein